MLLMDLDFQLPVKGYASGWCFDRFVRMQPADVVGGPVVPGRPIATSDPFTTLSFAVAQRSTAGAKNGARRWLGENSAQELALSLFHSVHALHPEGVLDWRILGRSGHRRRQPCAERRFENLHPMAGGRADRFFRTKVRAKEKGGVAAALSVSED
ncbi:MAG: hypothetical protein EOQ42_29780 [Mesorhizobium sp.]|nr:MAG: hypothetical protein EOQ42_29780 [Mesorhizobium sp.]